LRDRLAEQNVRIEKFEVEVRGSDTGALPDRTADQPNSSQQGQTGRGNRKRTDSSTEITGPTTANQRSSRDGQLNVVV
jgi:flagellar hook-length control protein FliK